MVLDNTDIKKEYTFLVSGDSISRGVVYDEEREKYIVLEDNYVFLLQNKLRGIVCNAAKFGNTIMKGMSRLPGEVIKNSPDIVLIEYGGNDCDFNWEAIANDPTGNHAPKTDFTQFQSKLKETILSLKEKSIMPILMTLPPLDADRYFKWVSKNNPLMGMNILKWLGSITKIYWWQERYNSAILKIANETQTRLIDIRSAFLEYPDFTKFICIDGIHPNKAGHQLIASMVLEYIHGNYAFLLKENTIVEY